MPNDMQKCVSVAAPQYSPRRFAYMVQQAFLPPELCIMAELTRRVFLLGASAVAAGGLSACSHEPPAPTAMARP
ncbi:MAG TPA: hypothetical protein VHG92_05165, partial [Afifellaceae bacterium]|nr:hypothetical protein [Afifellaceae bacterium]